MEESRSDALPAKLGLRGGMVWCALEEAGIVPPGDARGSGGGFMGSIENNQ